MERRRGEQTKGAGDTPARTQGIQCLEQCVAFGGHGEVGVLYSRSQNVAIFLVGLVLQHITLPNYLLVENDTTVVWGSTSLQNKIQQATLPKKIATNQISAFNSLSFTVRLGMACLEKGQPHLSYFESKTTECGLNETQSQSAGLVKCRFDWSVHLTKCFGIYTKMPWRREDQKKKRIQLWHEFCLP